jgi:8-amino-7-oxononanoate synthase
MASPSFPADIRIREQLAKRREEGVFRSLRTENKCIDFCSNDYLGFARSPELQKRIAAKAGKYPESGSTGSRLLSGNSSQAEFLEQCIAAFHTARAGLIFNSGYDANVGLFSALASRGDTVLYDSLIHASVRDGIRLSNAHAFNFKHNDLEHLEERLKSAARAFGGEGKVFVAVESIYSMDGDTCPLIRIASLCETYGANLIVDEAHATGVIGARGEGLVSSLGLRDQVFARVHTFGKALGCHGAIVLGSTLLRDYLINYARSFIYTTSLSPSSLASIECAYDLLEENPAFVQDLSAQVELFKHETQGAGITWLLPSNSPIQCVLVPGNMEVKKIADRIFEEGFDVRPIWSPTVQVGKERLRICIHRFNTPEQIRNLALLLQNTSPA